MRVCSLMSAAVLWSVLSGITGCAPVDPDFVNNGDVVDGNRDETVTSPQGKTRGEPNDDFTSSVVAVFDGGGIARLQGLVSRRGDLDVYNLGALGTGDRVIVDASTPGSALDISLAIFDSQGRLAVNNDDREEDNFNSYIDWVVRRTDTEYFLVATESAFAPSGQGSGSYELDISVQSGVVVPPAQAQILVLDFDGGYVNTPLLGEGSIAPFDASDISTVYRGQTEAMKDVIRDVVAQNYERFAVTVQTTDDPLPPSGTRYSAIYLGGFSESAFGIADGVDLYNVDRCDDGRIFTESFTLDQFSDVPTVAEMGTAIGNVTSHEAGHLLGLNHVSNEQDVMDDRSPADAFLLDQEFMESPLSGDIMSIGTQDGVLLLTDSVGLSE